MARVYCRQCKWYSGGLACTKHVKGTYHSWWNKGELNEAYTVANMHNDCSKFFKCTWLQMLCRRIFSEDYS